MVRLGVRRHISQTKQIGDLAIARTAQRSSDIRDGPRPQTGG